MIKRKKTRRVTVGGVGVGGGAGISNVNAAQLNGLAAANLWLLGGNNVTAGQFLGSTNNQPLEFAANGQRALRLEPSPSAFFTAPNVIGISGYRGERVLYLVEAMATLGYTQVGSQRRHDRPR